MSRSPRSNVRRLALGRLLSVTGGAAAFTALNFTVWDRTHSPFMQALSLLLTFGVAGLIGPFAGALGDRLDRRMVLIWSEAISCVFFTAMVFVHSPLVLILLAFASAIAELRSCRPRGRRSRTWSTTRRTSRGRTASSRWVCMRASRSAR